MYRDRYRCHGRFWLLSPASSRRSYGNLAILVWIVMGFGAELLGCSAKLADSRRLPAVHTHIPARPMVTSLGSLIAWGYWISVFSFPASDRDRLRRFGDEALSNPAKPRSWPWFCTLGVIWGGGPNQLAWSQRRWHVFGDNNLFKARGRLVRSLLEGFFISTSPIFSDFNRSRPITPRPSPPGSANHVRVPRARVRYSSGA